MLTNVPGLVALHPTDSGPAMHFCILYGSLRPNRLGIRLVRYFERKLGERGHDVFIADALALDLPGLTARYSEMGESAPAALHQLAEQFTKTDGFLVVGGEYNHLPQPGLLNMLDFFNKEYAHRPSAIATYSTGGFAGMRAMMALRAKLPVLGMPTIPTTYGQPEIQKALAEDGTPTDPEMTDKFAGSFLDQFEWYARALAAARAQGLPG